MSSADRDICFVLLFCAITIAAESNTTSVKHNEQESSISDAIKSLEATLERKFDQLIAAVNATSPEKSIVKSDPTFSTCKEIYANQKSPGNKAYLLQMDSGKIPVYCHMTSDGLGRCGGGGWTMVMKIDGNKFTFNYESKLWSNTMSFNLFGGETGFDTQETKLPTYWNTYFSKICLGMKIDEQLKFTVMHLHGDSLYSLIADGRYRQTKLDRVTWKGLIGSQASLQPNCNKEGFNVVSSRSTDHDRARIGFLGNDQNDCSTCDSRIGFGTGGYPDYTNTCGNVAQHGADNGDRRITAMGYILVQ